MRISNPALADARTTLSSRFAVFAELIKLRLTLFVLLTTVVGFYMHHQGPSNYTLLLHVLIGTGLVASGAQALNQFLEKEHDAKMVRTAQRPLPSGRLRPELALLYGGAASVIGLLYLAFGVNLLTSVLGAVTLVSYVLVYTPLKRVTPLNTIVGAVPGALPPLMGWTAVGGDIAHISLQGWSLVAILVFWQLPHFLAIAWMYREDYARAGFVMLPLGDDTGARTSQHALSYTLGLLPVSLAPFVLKMAGGIYLGGALLLGLLFLWCALAFARHRTEQAARRLFYCSLIYLPLLLGLMIFDKRG